MISCLCTLLFAAHALFKVARVIIWRCVHYLDACTFQGVITRHIHYYLSLCVNWHSSMVFIHVHYLKTHVLCHAAHISSRHTHYFGVHELCHSARIIISRHMRSWLSTHFWRSPSVRISTYAAMPKKLRVRLRPFPRWLQLDWTCFTNRPWTIHGCVLCVEKRMTHFHTNIF